MASDVPQRQYYPRKAKTAAQARVFDLVVGAKRRSPRKAMTAAHARIFDLVAEAKRRRLDSIRRVVVGNGVAYEGSSTSKMLMQIDDGDRISNLPQDVVQCILERLSVHDAARTSVLSKEWRCKWGMKTNLILDELFYSKLISANKDQDTHQSAFSKAIEMIALVHKGPLLSFNLYIPPKIDQCLVSRWIEHFLNKRISVLEISTKSEKEPYEIPLFVCQELVNLKLTTGILNQLPKPGGFTNLIKVQLNYISITADVSFGSQLKQLYLYACTGIQHLSCQFKSGNNLTELLLFPSEETEWRWFDCTKRLKFLGLALTTSNSSKRINPLNLIKLLRNTPSISILFLSGYTVEVLGPLHPMSKGLAPEIERLKLISLGFHNVCQLSNSLCLLRCLPNLQFLQIFLEPGVKSSNLTVEKFLESLAWNDMLLDQLHTVTILGVVAEKTLFHFIKVLLASSPSLRAVLLVCYLKADALAEIWKIIEELWQYPKKSLSAKLYMYNPNFPHCNLVNTVAAPPKDLLV